MPSSHTSHVRSCPLQLYRARDRCNATEQHARDLQKQLNALQQVQSEACVSFSLVFSLSFSSVSIMFLSLGLFLPSSVFLSSSVSLPLWFCLDLNWVALYLSVSLSVFVPLPCRVLSLWFCLDLNLAALFLFVPLCVPLSAFPFSVSRSLPCLSLYLPVVYLRPCICAAASACRRATISSRAHLSGSALNGSRYSHTLSHSSDSATAAPGGTGGEVHSALEDQQALAQAVRQHHILAKR